MPVTMPHRLIQLPKRLLMSFSLSAVALVACLCAGPAQARPSASAPSNTVAHAAGAARYAFANTDGYQASESVGNYPIVINRDDASQPGTICWGATNVSVEAGTNFTKVPSTHVDFVAGQSSATVYLPIHDQGINGPAELARAYMYGCGMGGVAGTPNQTITLLQNDPVPARDPTNVLGYQQPTNGDPLQFANWYIFGVDSAASLAAKQYERSNAAWSTAFNVLANTPGSGSVRFWMWNQPTTKIAGTVE
jgi:hypothetical protein